MGIYDIHADAPNQIEKEGQQITVRFERLPNQRGKITWNIPSSVAGCASGQKPVYDGIVITVDNIPANYITTSPQDGEYYNGDPTVDLDLHAGDKLETARVLGAFYHDTTTTSLIVTDVKERTSYFISAYAVDNVGRYHMQGVHAYSLPTGPKETGTEDKAAYHDILFDSGTPIRSFDSTALQSGVDYSLRVRINGKQYDLSVDGEDSLTFTDLIKEINYEFAKLENPFFGPEPPNAGGYYYDILNNRLFLWNGNTNQEKSVIVRENDPALRQVGDFWYDTENKILYIWNGTTWVETPFIDHPADPTALDCDTYWFDGTILRRWNGNTWCESCFYSQTRNPILGVDPACGAYWFNTELNEFYQWNTTFKKWDDRLVLVSENNPNNLPDQAFWYDETEKVIKFRVEGLWQEQENVRYSERNEEGDLDYPSANVLWYIPSENKLYLRNDTNTDWLDLSNLVISYPTSPTDRNSCDLWWFTTDDILYAWDSISNSWVEVNQFFQSATDPTESKEITECEIWYNPETEEFKKILNTSCVDIFPILTTENPADLTEGTVWRNSQTGEFKLWDGTEWISVDIISLSFDPNDFPDNYFWFRPSDSLLSERVNGTWVQVQYSETPLTPIKGDKWFNTVDEILLEWNSVQWVPINALAYAEFVDAEQFVPNSRSKISFFTKDKGCRYGIEVLVDGTTLFSSIRPSIIYTEPVFGASGIVAGSSVNHLGVGTDGSPDERRELHHIVRQAFGYPSVQVELTKDQIDSAIDSALNTLRKYSGYGYERVWFFMDLIPNQQIYLMTNKCVGFNKIVSINSLHRIRSGAFRTSVFQTDIHAYAALQSLYTMGTFDLLSFHLVASYVEQLEELFAAHLMFAWRERSRELKIHQIVKGKERILVDANIEKTEQELLTNRNTVSWVRGWTIAECKLILSQVRGKFQTLPGPNGSTTLNSQELITQGESEKLDLMDKIMDVSMQNIDEHGMRSQFIAG